MKRQRKGKSKARREYERLRANILKQVSYYKNRYGLILNTQIPKSYGELKRAGEIKGLAKEFEKLNRELGRTRRQIKRELTPPKRKVPRAAPRPKRVDFDEVQLGNVIKAGQERVLDKRKEKRATIPDVSRQIIQNVTENLEKGDGGHLIAQAIRKLEAKHGSTAVAQVLQEMRNDGYDVGYKEYYSRDMALLYVAELEKRVNIQFNEDFNAEDYKEIMDAVYQDVDYISDEEIEDLSIYLEEQFSE